MLKNWKLIRFSTTATASGAVGGVSLVGVPYVLYRMTGFRGIVWPKVAVAPGLAVLVVRVVLVSEMLEASDDARRCVIACRAWRGGVRMR